MKLKMQRDDLVGFRNSFFQIRKNETDLEKKQRERTYR